MSKYLVLIDVDQIQSYVFSTHRLREIRYASALVGSINRDIERILQSHLPSTAQLDTLIDAAGLYKGIVTGDNLSKNDVEKAVEAAALSFTKATHSLTATWYVSPFGSGAFGPTLERAEKALKAKKRQRSSLPQFPSHPLFRLCDLCGQRPAGRHPVNAPSGEKEFLCLACEAKSKAPASLSKTGLGRVEKGVCKQVKDIMEEDCEVTLPKDFGGVVQRQTKTTGSSKESVDTAEYMALVYADGNSMGKMWQQFEGTVDQCRDISNTISHAVEDALIEAVTACFRERKDSERKFIRSTSYVVPFIPLLIGGDDIVCVTAGSWGLQLAAKFAREFTKRLASQLAFDAATTFRPSMSAGVVISKCSYPIQQGMSIAKELLRNAKRISRSVSNTPGPGTIDFEIVKQTSLRSVEEWRNTYYEGAGTGLHLLTERPYLISNSSTKDHLPINKLFDALQFASGLPTSKLKSLSSLLRDNNYRDERFAEFHAGLREDQKNSWKGLADALDIDDTWKRTSGTIHRSGILDVVELLGVRGM